MTHFNKNTVKAIRAWLKKHHFHSLVRMEKEMAYDPTIDTIVIPSVYDSYCDEWFMRFLRSHGLIGDFDGITLSILHELGHAKTVKNFTEDEWADCAIEKQILDLMALSDEEYINAYWTVENEYVANIWAIEFANKHPKLVQELEDMIASTLVEM